MLVLAGTLILILLLIDNTGLWNTFEIFVVLIDLFSGKDCYRCLLHVEKKRRFFPSSFAKHIYVAGSMHDARVNRVVRFEGLFFVWSIDEFGLASLPNFLSRRIGSGFYSGTSQNRGLGRPVTILPSADKLAEIQIIFNVT